MGKNTQQINIVKHVLAQEPVQTDYQKGTPVKAVRYVGKQDVYNMEVKDFHNFSVEGGLIVHNSIDAVRYALEDDMTNNRRLVTLNKNRLGL